MRKKLKDIQNNSSLDDPSKKKKRKFDFLRKRLVSLRKTKSIAVNREKLLDSYDFIELINELFVESKTENNFKRFGLKDDIDYYLNQLEENIHQLEMYDYAS